MIDILSSASAFLDTLFPRRCLVCSVFLSHPLSSASKKPPALESYLCDACRQALRVPNANANYGVPQLFGGDKVFSGYIYRGSLEKIIPPWKYHDRSEFFPLIKTLLGLSLSRQHLSDFDFDLILAVPLAPKALRKRGFNQAFFIASCCSEFLAHPLGRNILCKAVDTPQQASLDRRARARNLRAEVFKVPEPEKICGKNILLCDDVLTTGATLRATMKVLKNAGAASVTAMTLARVVR